MTCVPPGFHQDDLNMLLVSMNPECMGDELYEMLKMANKSTEDTWPAG
jgi:hypothetical protein